MRIGMDVDGVLANWDEGFRLKLIEASGRVLCPPGFQPETWHWPEAVGYTDEEIKEAHFLSCNDTAFWTRLSPMPGAERFLSDIWRLFGNIHVLIQNGTVPDPTGLFTPEIYFITSRYGPAVKDATHDWISRHGWTPQQTSVLINRHGLKGEICKALGINVFIDDRPDNCVDVRRKCPDARVFMLARQHNADVTTQMRSLRIDSIDLDQFRQLVVDSYARTDGLPEGHLYATN